MTKVNTSEVKVSFQFTLTIHTIEEDGPDDFSEPGEGDMQMNGWNINIYIMSILCTEQFNLPRNGSPPIHQMSPHLIVVYFFFHSCFVENKPANTFVSRPKAV